MRSKYKAAGKSAAALITQKSAVGDVEYEKEYELGRYGKQLSLIGSIGSTIANILGIVDERKRLSRFEGYRQEAAGLPGISAIEKEYQPLGGFGKLIGLDPRTRTDYISSYTGRALPDEMMTAIGFAEQHGMSTKYSDVESIGESMRERIPAKTYRQAGVSGQEEYEREMGMGEFSLEDVPIGEQGRAELYSPVSPGSQTVAEEAIDPSLFGGPEIPMDWELEGGGQWVDEWLKDNPNHPKAKEWLNKQSKKTAASKSDKPFDVVESVVKSGQEGDNILEDIAGVKGGMSEFEKNIAMSENAPFFESGSVADSLFPDKYMATGEERPAYGFGTKYTGKEDKSFTASVTSMRSHISDTESQLQKAIGKDAWSSLPQSVRESVTEMGYIMGVPRLKERFKNMIAALKAGDIDRAGMEATWSDKEKFIKADWISQIREKRSDRILAGFRLDRKPQRLPTYLTGDL